MRLRERVQFGTFIIEEPNGIVKLARHLFGRFGLDEAGQYFHLVQNVSMMTYQFLRPR